MRLAGCPAAIQHQGLRSHMPRGITAEKRCSSSNFINTDKGFLRHRRQHNLLYYLLFGQVMLFGLSGNLLLYQRCFHVGRAYCINSEVDIGIFQRHDFAKTKQAMLGGNIG